jgi:GDPmannose 4,6-dehydratase
MPDEIYHLASNVDPRVVFEDEINTFDNNFRAAINLLHAIKLNKNDSRLYCAGSSLMFGDVKETPQNEQTCMKPTTPYGIAKVATFHFINMYRQAYGIFACTGILFNHESPRRDDRFLPKKITKAVANIKLGLQDSLVLGNIDLKRDWSFAKDVVTSMWLMLQASEPKDYVIGSGELHTIRDILDIAFDSVGLDWREFVVSDDKFFRKIEYDNLCADSSKARVELNWKSTLTFEEMIADMVCSDLKIVGFEND